MTAYGSTFERQFATKAMKQQDEGMLRHKTFEYPCEAHLTWCCGGDDIRRSKLEGEEKARYFSQRF